MKEIALHILDISQNSVSAGADRIRVCVEKSGEWISVKIEDNGEGMDRVTRKSAEDPFFTSRSTRRVGLGIPLLKQHAEMTGGKLKLESVPGKGTTIEAAFRADHPDLQPLGDLEGCWILMATSYPEVEWELDCRTDRGFFKITTSEIREVLSIERIAGEELKVSLKSMIRNQIESIHLD